MSYRDKSRQEIEPNDQSDIMFHQKCYTHTHMYTHTHTHTKVNIYIYIYI